MRRIGLLSGHCIAQLPPLDYHCYRITTDQPDVILAFLGEQPFDSFEQTEAGLAAYVPTASNTPTVHAAVQALVARFGGTFSVTHIPAQNWNAAWEADFHPIRVADFVGIRADFHPPTAGVAHDLLIHPRMAFGTGHHATTYQMVERMRALDFSGQRVLDYGCGTGVLAVLAAKLGATYVEAVDVEQPAFENTVDNIRLNHTPGIRVVHGTLADIDGTDFGIILANINRHVILDSLAALYGHLVPGGAVLFSGILLADETLVIEALAARGFRLVHRQEREGWLCLHVEKPKL